MGGTVTGGKAAAATNKRLYGLDYYARMGAKGGKKGSDDGTIKGFALMNGAKHKLASAKGGRISRRSKES